MVNTDDFAETVEVLPAMTDFRKGSRSCFDRTATDNWAVVDAHLHGRPFGGPPVPFSEMMDRQRRAGVLFTTFVWNWAAPTSGFQLHLLFGLPWHACQAQLEERLLQRSKHVGQPRGRQHSSHYFVHVLL